MQRSHDDPATRQPKRSPSALVRPPAGLTARLRVIAGLLRDAPLVPGNGGRLIWRNNHNEVMSLALPSSLVMGREAKCNLTLSNPQISRRHCEITLRGGRAWIADLGSTNGTRLNGRRVAGAMPLCDGDLIELGGECLAYIE